MSEIRFGNGVVIVPDDATHYIKREDLIVLLSDDGRPIQAHMLMKGVLSKFRGRTIATDEVVEFEQDLLDTGWALYVQHRQLDFTLAEGDNNVKDLVSWARILYKTLRFQIPVPLNKA